VSIIPAAGGEGRGGGRDTDRNDWEAQVEVVSGEDDGLQRHGAGESTVMG
jgi:hypothetical protein